VAASSASASVFSAVSASDTSAKACSAVARYCACAAWAAALAAWLWCSRVPAWKIGALTPPTSAQNGLPLANMSAKLVAAPP
jgi:transcription elongation factor